MIIIVLLIILVILSVIIDDIGGIGIIITGMLFFIFIVVGLSVRNDSIIMEAEGRELILMRDGATDPNDILEIDWRITVYNKDLVGFQKQQGNLLFFGLFISETIQEVKRIDRSFEVQLNE